ncbi:MAG: winged helix-turn-helix domain-containing protein [Pseudomonadota bacterium]
MTTQREPFTLDELLVEPQRNAVSTATRVETLEPRIMDVLCTLAAAEGAVISREQLIDAVWPSAFGADESLTRAISVIRKTLRALDPEQDFIETIPKRGYRLRVAVGSVDDPNVPEETPPVTPKPVPPGSSAPSRRRIGATVAVLVTAVLVVVVGWIAQQRLPSAQRDAGTRTLAVLPFAALSQHDEDQIFADGLSTQLLTTLAKVPDLAVTSRRSAFSVRALDLDAPAIGDRLGVAYFLDGTVQRTGTNLEVTANLVEAKTGKVLWAETYAQSRRELGRVQDDIVTKVGRQLEIELGVGRYTDRPAGGAANPEALEAYYLGLGYFGDRGREDAARRKAFNAFRTAVELDPSFADAWAALALVGTTSLDSPLGRDREPLIREIAQAFERATALDPENVATHTALTFWHLGVAFDLDQARLHAERALALRPDSSDAQYAMAGYYRIAGDVEQARALYQRAADREPNNANKQMIRAAFLADIGETENAFAFFESCFERQCLREGFVPFASGYAVLSRDPERKQQWLPRWEAFEQVLLSLPPEAKPDIARIAPGFFSLGFDRADKAERIAELRAVFATEPVIESIGLWGPSFADVLPEDDFFIALELAAERGALFASAHGLMPYYGTNPYPDWVLSHPRYQALFDQPALARFVELRRQNGWTDGLPQRTLD